MQANTVLASCTGATAVYPTSGTWLQLDYLKSGTVSVQSVATTTNAAAQNYREWTLDSPSSLANWYSSGSSQNSSHSFYSFSFPIRGLQINLTSGHVKYADLNDSNSVRRVTMTMAGNVPERKRPDHLFKPGQSGNYAGRPKGSRNKLSEDFLKALASDFAEHGAAAIAEVRTNKPEHYLKAICSVLPRGLELDVSVGPSQELYVPP